MPALARSRRALATLAALLLAALVAAAAGPYGAAAQSQPAPRILVLRGGDAASDSAAIAALQSHGLDAVSGPLTAAYAGDPAVLASVDVVVALFNSDSGASLDPAGIAALDAFVRGGGGLVAAEWLIFSNQLAALMPATHCGWNTSSSTTYTRATPTAAVDDSIPADIPVSLTTSGGSESCLEAKPGASVLYTSSNGGGRGSGAGLVAWNIGLGRVAAFSSLIGAAELQGSAYRRLFQNTVQWLATTRDTTPPQITAFSVSGAGGIVSQPQLQITLAATDSGSGVATYYIREYGFSGDLSEDRGWNIERASPVWQPYPPSGSFAWNLTATPGVRYLQAFVADNAGNIAADAAVAIVNYSPALTGIGQDGLQIYRITPRAGDRTTVRMDVGSGNPDLYVFGPGVPARPESDSPVEEYTFTAQAIPYYQVEVAGFTAGSFTLSASSEAGGPGGPGSLAPARRPRITITAISPPEPREEPATLPPAPVEPAPASVTTIVHLPLVTR
jgi:hypothetical protein